MLLSRKHSQAVSPVMLTFIQIPCVNYRKVIKSVCISLVFKDNGVMQCNECTQFIYNIFNINGFKSKVIIPQQQLQHSHFEINKHQYRSININMKVFDPGLNKGLHFFYNQPFNCFIDNDF